MTSAKQDHVAGGGTTPERQRLAKRGHRRLRTARGQGRATGADESLEAAQVERVRAGVEEIAGRPPHQHGAGRATGPSGLEEFAEVGHIDLEHAAGALGRVLAPQLVDQPVC
jgi:hypothetical protein